MSKASSSALFTPGFLVPTESTLDQLCKIPAYKKNLPKVDVVYVFIFRLYLYNLFVNTLL